MAHLKVLVFGENVEEQLAPFGIDNDATGVGEYEWDWWEIGGRFAGGFTLRPDADPQDHETPKPQMLRRIFDKRAGLKRTSTRTTNRARKRAITINRDTTAEIYAVVQHGQWHSLDRPDGWASDPEDVSWEQWAPQVNRLISEAPEDEWLTIVDCHL
ncbi:hypothetical protein [Micrococcoides hystricis]|uniref:Uncharacterized protein n=1 Tax=Micrococcoides hystricis TaxID=1572761 RepID=A0ABV6PDL7_9MICC